MTFDSQRVENTLWFDFGVSPDLAGLNTLADDLIAWWGASYAPLVSSGVQLREVVCTDQSSPTGPQVTVAPAVGLFGANTSPPKPSNVSVTVSFRTALRGRSYRGRNYIVGLTNDTMTLNTLNVGFIGDAIDAYAALLPAGAAGITPQWVVASRFSGVDAQHHAIPRVTGIATPIETVTIVDAIVDSQRRRLPGRGN